MSIEVAPQTIKNLYIKITSNLSEQRLTPSNLTPLINEIVKKGWVLPYQGEDWFSFTEPGPGHLRYREKLIATADEFGFPLRAILPSTQAKKNSGNYMCGWPSLEFASFLIRLERLGFTVGAERLVRALLPTIPNSHYLPDFTIDVIQYERRRFSQFINLVSPCPTGAIAIKKHKSASGFRIVAWLNSNGDPVNLSVSGKNYRQRMNV